MKRPLALLAVLGAVGSGLAGCATPNPAAVDPVANDVPLSCPVPVGAPLTLAVSHRANSPAGLPEPVRDLVARAVASVPGGATGSPISVIDVDGRPSLVTSVEYRPAAGNAYGRADQDTALLRGFDQAMSAMRADDPQVDVLAALDEAAAAAGRPAAGTVVLVDSGLSTTGPLDFTVPGLLDAPPAEVVDYLRSIKALPDLSGLTVILVGVGEVAKPQAALGGRARTVRELWKAVASAGAAACVGVLETARPAEPVIGVPPVSLVPVPPAVGFQTAGRVVLPDVAFQPGEASFRNADEVADGLRPTVDWLRADPARRLLLTGTTARWGNRDYQVGLAARRIATVQDLIVGSGIDPHRIEAQPLGSYFRDYVPDTGPDGTLLPGPAQQNRTVRIDRCTPDCPRER